MPKTNQRLMIGVDNDDDHWPKKNYDSRQTHHRRYIYNEVAERWYQA